MKFITGSTRIPMPTVEWLGDTMGARLRRLPISSTCSLVLMLHDTYENNDGSRINLEADLDIFFFNSNGFNEKIYRDSYMRLERNTSNLTDRIETIDLTIDDITNNQQAILLHETSSTISSQSHII
ncbi:hypothetical protein RclHR1_07490003 [Rhizophagus clarus]|uniref:HECT domain-containing protein n=1 Tax=Rhizophagus clarus TaxID=94130 RepID=A0A2Z6RWK4_9GLOM|nr:hypothetical protein RclHR1_07490003 [Rhizophagus clarus]GET00740.1 hypothetical protein GLOIN_2v1837680 [Rhizophagus clarus]